MPKLSPIGLTLNSCAALLPVAIILKSKLNGLWGCEKFVQFCCINYSHWSFRSFSISTINLIWSNIHEALLHNNAIGISSKPLKFTNFPHLSSSLPSGPSVTSNWMSKLEGGQNFYKTVIFVIHEIRFISLIVVGGRSLNTQAKFCSCWSILAILLAL